MSAEKSANMKKLRERLQANKTPIVNPITPGDVTGSQNGPKSHRPIVVG